MLKSLRPVAISLQAEEPKMADITAPLTVRFSNEKARVFADSLVTTYETARAFSANWEALGIAAVCPNTADLVADGSEIDGRGRVTGAKLNALKTQADALLTWFEAGSPSRITQFRQIAVTGGSRI